MKKEEKKEDDNRLKDVIEINQNQNYKIENYKKDNSFRNKNDYYRNKNSRYQYNNKYYNQRQYFNNNYKNDYSQKKNFNSSQKFYENDKPQKYYDKYNSKNNRYDLSYQRSYSEYNEDLGYNKTFSGRFKHFNSVNDLTIPEKNYIEFEVDNNYINNEEKDIYENDKLKYTNTKSESNDNLKELDKKGDLFIEKFNKFSEQNTSNEKKEFNKERKRSFNFERKSKSNNNLSYDLDYYKEDFGQKYYNNRKSSFNRKQPYKKGYSYNNNYSNYNNNYSNYNNNYSNYNNNYSNYNNKYSNYNKKYYK
jgi:hypothetical protein